VSYYGQFESGGNGDAAPADAGTGLADAARAEDPPEQSVTIEITESAAGAEAPNKEQGLI